MAGSQPGCEETRFTGDEKPAPGSLRFDLTKKVGARSYGQDETPSPRCGVFSRCCQCISTDEGTALCRTSSGHIGASKRTTSLNNAQTARSRRRPRPKSCRRTARNAYTARTTCLNTTP